MHDADQTCDSSLLGISTTIQTLLPSTNPRTPGCRAYALSAGGPPTNSTGNSSSGHAHATHAFSNHSTAAADVQAPQPLP
jgi:hypothetical protein